jgi:hypothetical protein
VARWTTPARSRSSSVVRATVSPQDGPVLTTGSATLDTVLEIGIALCLLVSLVLLWRNVRGR